MGEEWRIAAAVIGGIVALSGIAAIVYAAILSAAVGSYAEYIYPLPTVMYVIGGILLVVGGIPFLWGLSGLVGGGKKSSVTAPVSRPTAQTSEGTGGWEESFNCGRCGMPATAYKVKIKGPSAKVKAVCPIKHEWEFLLPMSQQAEWIDTLTAHIFRCKKCGTQLLYPKKLKYREGYAEYKLRCPTCGSSHRYVKMLLYNVVEDARHRLMARARE